jgi:hypothetical protein
MSNPSSQEPSFRGLRAHHQGARWVIFDGDKLLDGHGPFLTKDDAEAAIVRIRATDDAAAPCNPLAEPAWNMLDVIDWLLHQSVEHLCASRRLFKHHFTEHPSGILWMSGIMPEAIWVRAEIRELQKSGDLIISGRKNDRPPRREIKYLWMRDLRFKVTPNDLVLVDQNGNPIWTRLEADVPKLLKVRPPKDAAAPPPPQPQPALRRKLTKEDALAIYRDVTDLAKNAKDWDKAANERAKKEFGCPMPVALRQYARQELGLHGGKGGRPGTPPKNPLTKTL